MTSSAISDHRYGFRILGSCRGERRLVDATKAFAGYAAADPKAECDSEGYLSAFWFDSAFRDHLTATGSTREFDGSTWSPWVWFDLDAEDDLSHAQADAAALIEWLVENAAVDPDPLLLFFSGSKGFHVGLPTAWWTPSPSADFHRVCRRFAEAAAEGASVTIDTGVYDRVRAFRAPNSRHPKTGFHKRRLTFGELCGPLDAILDLARTPTPFDLPPPPADRNGPLADLWQYAVDQVAAQTEAKAQRRAAGNGATTLNRQTLAFIREGAAPGDRHRLLFSAAANLGEFGCPLALATALLRESGLDSGLPPREVDRQIRCGLEGAEVGDATQPAAEASPPDWPPAESQAIVGTRPQDPPCRYCGSTAFFETALPDGRIAIGCCKDGLPPRTLSIGQWRDRCRCGSDQVVEVAISDGRTRIDCRNCGKFLRFGRWYTPEEVNA